MIVFFYIAVIFGLAALIALADEQLDRRRRKRDRRDERLRLRQETWDRVNLHNSRRPW